MNRYTNNLNRIEFLVTLACTGQCKHCSEGEHTAKGCHIEGDIAADMIYKVTKNYNINSLMTFGGEPLLYPDEVYKIHAAAYKSGISERQLITNGFFSNNEIKIHGVAERLVKSGINNLLLSVDAFHQETIPLEPVIIFAKAIYALGMKKFHVHPAWLVSQDADNPFNNKTREILAVFNDLGIPTSNGNVIFPKGNALKNLSGYFDLNQKYVNKYEGEPHNVKSLCVEPNGDVLNKNIYKTDIIDILTDYTPE